MSIYHDVVVIGGGAAGLAAACAAKAAGAGDVVIFEREGALGGILKQCIHNGFGLHRFDEELTGPEYAAREVESARACGISVFLETTVLSLDGERHIVAVSPTEGLIDVDAGAVVLAMGSRERTRGALNIPGTRPAGIYTAGAAQHMVNLEGVIPGREVVMLGSGDIGLIMARRLTFEGVHVKMVLNRSHFSGGLKRNIVQCLDDYGIPLLLSHTVTNVYGHGRLSGVGVSKVDPATKKPIPGSEELVKCDTLLLSVGLMPENELSRAAGVQLDVHSGGAVVDENLETSIPGVFSAGNVLHIHDLVDFVSEEGERAGRAAAEYSGQREQRGVRSVVGSECSGVSRSIAGTQLVSDGTSSTEAVAGFGLNYVVPQHLSAQATGDVTFRFRSRDVYHNATISVRADGVEVKHARRRVIVPAEMESITVPAASCTGAERIEVSIVTEREGVR